MLLYALLLSILINYSQPSNSNGAQDDFDIRSAFSHAMRANRAMIAINEILPSYSSLHQVGSMVHRTYWPGSCSTFL
uniref:Putative secreted protein n=1 Tax=Anopheles darlingi TaxID=43151 RepID=A0A2M4DEC3_ANODA